MDKEGGERLWRQARVLLSAIDGDYDQAGRSLETAFMLDESRAQYRARLADLRFEHLRFAEDFRLGGSKAEVLRERLAVVDTDGSRRKALAAPGRLALQTTPVATRVVLERYERDPANGRRNPKTVSTIDGASSTTSLIPGSYRLVIDGPGLAHVLYPVEVKAGETTTADLKLPAASVIPEGFAYVPAGDFWFGDADEQLRTQFLNAAPIHRRSTGPYLIAKHETTYGEWIAFLRALPHAERQRNLPDVNVSRRGSLQLREAEDGWQFTFQPTTRRYVARSGEPVVYDGRRQGARQDWLRFPVAGISPAGANEYFAWLRSTGRVPGARMCTEAEWERAARGADDRLFPHGDELTGEDANIDETYGRVDAAYGPDEVGSHPASRSPFGVDDLAGNVFDLVTSSLKPNELVIRGGAYWFQPISERSTNREPVPASYRDITTGIRVCANSSEEK
jgi:formylglycine-generating enzyme required for sulfatase activity